LAQLEIKQIKQKQKEYLSITKNADDNGFQEEQIKNFGYVATQDFIFGPQPVLSLTGLV
jgi:hypothetical protein